VARLRAELEDEGVELGDDGYSAALLEEIDYARRPPVHEGNAPRYGAIVGAGHEFTTDVVRSEVVDGTHVGAGILRRLADGRSSFYLRLRDGHGLLTLDRTIEHEATAVRVAVDSRMTVVQRRTVGHVRVFDRRGVVMWDGSRWWSKPLGRDLAAQVRRALGRPLSPVLDGLCDLCVHWLSANRVGALLLWRFEDAIDLDRHLGSAVRIDVPPLDMTDELHFSAALSLLAQTDRAAVVQRDGTLDCIGIALRPSDLARDRIAPFGGTRHTAAIRFSHDEPGTLVFVVSSAGPVSVMCSGRVVAGSSSTSIVDSESGA
jgi:DNA integrity scanning protein DisA with diadenylate cyclase activity